MTKTFKGIVKKDGKRFVVASQDGDELIICSSFNEASKFASKFQSIRNSTKNDFSKFEERF